jgi:hypothetical protein
MFGSGTSWMEGSFSVVKKWPVLPVSAMVCTMMGGLWAGGPKNFGNGNCVGANKVLFFVVTLNAVIILGSPRPQVVVVGGTVGVFRGCGTYTWISPLFRWMRLLPPNMF